MDKDILSKLIQDGLSTYQIAEKLNCSQTNTRHWLAKYDLSTIRTQDKLIPRESKKCNKCNQIKKREEFYSRKDSGGTTAYCISCSKNLVIERQRNFKQKCIDYKGGKCEKCGYCKCKSALEFHHREPGEKDFDISRTRTNFREETQKELDKCDLLCSNCHRETHEILERVPTEEFESTNVDF